MEGESLHAFGCGPDGYWDRLGYLEFTHDGRVLSGTVVDELILKGPISTFWSANVNWKIDAYVAEGKLIRMSTTRGGFWVEDDNQNLVERFCGQYGYGRFWVPYLSYLSVHRIVFGTQQFLDIGSGNWMSVTDQPYHFYPDLYCRGGPGGVVHF